jgi:hypothetical protein
MNIAKINRCVLGELPAIGAGLFIKGLREPIISLLPHTDEQIVRIGFLSDYTYIAATHAQITFSYLTESDEIKYEVAVYNNLLPKPATYTFTRYEISAFIITQADTIIGFISSMFSHIEAAAKGLTEQQIEKINNQESDPIFDEVTAVDHATMAMHTVSLKSGQTIGIQGLPADGLKAKVGMLCVKHNGTIDFIDKNTLH